MVTIFRLCLIKTIHTATQPIVRQIKTLTSIRIIGRTGRTFVKSHHNIGTDGTLNIHHAFRREEMLTSVNVRAKFAALST